MVRKNAELARKDSEFIDDNVVVAIDKDKGSQYALKWAVDQFLNRGQSVTLLHVLQKISPSQSPSTGGSFISSTDSNETALKSYSKFMETEARDLFLPFRCFCTRKDIICHEVVIEDSDIAKAIVDYAFTHVIETIILGTPTKGGLITRKFKTTDIPSTVSKIAPEFCNVYVINKGKVSSQRPASAPLPAKSSAPQIGLQLKTSSLPLADGSQTLRPTRTSRGSPPYHSIANGHQEDTEMIKSPFTRGRSTLGKQPEANYTPYEHYGPELDISFVSSGRPSSTDRLFSPLHESFDPNRRTGSTDYDHRSFGSVNSGGTGTSMDMTSLYSGSSQESGQTTWYSNNMDDMESEVRKLRLELKQTMEMYSTACREALSAKQKTREYQRWKLEEQHKVEEARIAEEAALALIEKEKAKCRAAIDAAHAAQRLAELEADRRISVEKSPRDSEGIKKMKEPWAASDIRYRRYTIEEIEAATDDFAKHLKIGEGGYGPVYKCYLDHTEVAVKVLRADAAQGMSQFHQEVEVLSCIRHPNMVLLLGACPEYGCLVYEYMASGSLDDRLFRRGNTPPLPWQVRFRIAAEIATGLLFLHQAKPEPLVHRDLKPGNILLDRNLVSKISDVGLARLVPPSIADTVTQYRMTSTAGTFCYIDPEYQQTGMLGTKSDIYSLGVLLLQVITAKSPMGLAHLVESAIEDGTFLKVLDPSVPDWPMEETLTFARLALQCAELRKKDRPDLGKVVLPELNKLRTFGDENMPFPMFGGIFSTTSSIHSHISSLQEAMMSSPSDCSTLSSSSSLGGRR